MVDCTTQILSVVALAIVIIYFYDTIK